MAPDSVNAADRGWNGRNDAQMAGIREWGGKFVVPIPAVKVVD